MMETTVSGSRPAEGAAAAEDSTIRPFRVSVPEEELVELRRRIQVTRWPEKETVADQSQGVRSATMQELVRYWGADYDLRRFEARLNALPQFITEIDGLDIHFIHAKSPHEHALPLIITHGWPGSVIEMVGSLPAACRPCPRLRHPDAGASSVLHGGHRLLQAEPGAGGERLVDPWTPGYMPGRGPGWPASPRWRWIPGEGMPARWSPRLVMRPWSWTTSMPSGWPTWSAGHPRPSGP
jgi:hypothetical protein